MTASRTEYFLVDPGGVERGKWAPGKSPEDLETTSVAFPLSLMGLDVWGREVAETGLHIESGDLDGACAVVASSARPMPWLEGDVLQAMLDMGTTDGRPFFGNSRNALQAAIARLARLGLSATAAIELEFYLSDPRRPEQADGVERQAMYDLKAMNRLRPVFDEIRRCADIQAVPADTIISEASAGQFEVNLLHRADALAAADDAVCLKRIVAGAAAKHGLCATFMAKPFAGRPGNGLHVHASFVTAQGKNFFGETETGAQSLEHAVGGLLSTMQDGMLVFANSWNGFRRFEPGSYAPNKLNWGDNNRSVAIRIPASSPRARRFEHRISGADANPYLVLALILHGAAHGLEQAIAPPEKSAGNAYDGDAPVLKSHMGRAIARFAASDWIRSCLGADLQALVAAVKRQECAVFESHISEFERETYR